MTNTPDSEAHAAKPARASSVSWAHVKTRILPPFLALAIAAVLASGALPIACPIRLVLGVPCPGCGMTRASRLLVHGDLRAALAMHPLVLVLGPWCAILLVAEIAGHVRHGRFVTAVRSRFLRVGSYVVFGGAIAMWIARFFGAFGGPAPL